MKIIVKQEADTTCAWIVGEDGETLPYSESNPTSGDGTAYLKDGQQVEIDVEIAAVGTEEGQRNYPKATLGEVTAIADAEKPAPEAEEQNVAEDHSTDEPVSGRTAGAVPGDPEVRGEDDQPGGANDKSVLK